MPKNAEVFNPCPKQRKTRPVRDKSLLETVRTLPCLGCMRTPSDAHHVTTVGAGGGDTVDNVMPLCRDHHQEWHRRGGGYMADKYGAVWNWLVLASREDVLKKAKRHAGH